MANFFNSDREFVLWEYSVSHQQLVFRSNKQNENDKTIDIVFKYVKFICCISDYLEGLKISVILDKNEKEKISEKYAIKIRTHELFEITTKTHNQVNYIIAGFSIVFESKLDYAESILYQNEGKGKIIEIMPRK